MHYHPRKHYGFGKLILDFLLVMLTQGLWLIWIIIRYFRSNTKVGGYYHEHR